MEFFFLIRREIRQNILCAVANDYYHMREPLIHHSLCVYCVVFVHVCACMYVYVSVWAEYTCAHSIRKKKILFLVVLFCLLLAPRVLSLDLMGILNCWLYLSEHICYTFSDNHFGFFVFSSILVPMFSNRSSSQFSQQETTCLLLLKEILVCGM